MTRTVPRRTLAAAAVAAAAALCACGHSKPTRLFTLTASPPAAPAAAAGYAGPVIEVGAVRPPAALDRAELLSEVGPDQLQAREFDRWAAPLPRLARAAFAQDLALRLPPGRVALPDAPPDAFARRLTVSLLTFSVREDRASLSAGWALTCAGGVGRPRASRAEVQASAVGDVAPGLNAVLALLADRIVAEVAADPPGFCTPPPPPPAASPSSEAAGPLIPDVGAGRQDGGGRSSARAAASTAPNARPRKFVGENSVVQASSANGSRR